jgi:hypothetical protein
LLAVPFATGGHFHVSRFEFVVPLSDLLLDFFGDQVNGGIQIAFDVLGEKVRTRQGDAHRAGELALGGPGLIMLDGNPRRGREPVQVFEFIDSADDVIFDGPRQAHIVSRKNQIHWLIVVRRPDKIQ